MFEKQHYVKLAEAIKKERAATKDTNAQVALAGFTVHLADALESDNPNFQRGRFYKGAGFYAKDEDAAS